MLEGHNLSWLPIAVGMLCLLYYFVIIGLLGFRMDFSLIWLFGGGVLILIGLLQVSKYGRAFIDRIPAAVFVVAAVFVAVFGTILFILFGLINSAADKKPVSSAEYCIVLGSKTTKGNIPTIMLRRLEAAEEYYRTNPEIIFVVSGGQGRDEDATEASVMKDYLISHGVPSEQIIEEGKSGNTDENLDFSYALIRQDFENRKKGSDGELGIIICTSGFHVCRALCLARNKKFENVSGLAAKGRAELELNYRIRECVGLMKELAVGNIRLRDLF